jgi:hypothetical protein
MTPATRQKQALAMQRFVARCRQNGWIPQRMWITWAQREQIAAKAAHLGMDQHLIASAALSAGLRGVTNGEIIRVAQHWREKVRPANDTRFKKGNTGGPRHPVTGQFIGRTPADTVHANVI